MKRWCSDSACLQFDCSTCIEGNAMARVAARCVAIESAAGFVVRRYEVQDDSAPMSANLRERLEKLRAVLLGDEPSASVGEEEAECSDCVNDAGEHTYPECPGYKRQRASDAVCWGVSPGCNRPTLEACRAEDVNICEACLYWNYGSTPNGAPRTNEAPLVDRDALVGKLSAVEEMRRDYERDVDFWKTRALRAERQLDEADARSETPSCGSTVRREPPSVSASACPECGATDPEIARTKAGFGRCFDVYGCKRRKEIAAAVADTDQRASDAVCWGVSPGCNRPTLEACRAEDVNICEACLYWNYGSTPNGAPRTNEARPEVDGPVLAALRGYRRLVEQDAPYNAMRAGWANLCGALDAFAPRSETAVPSKTSTERAQALWAKEMGGTDREFVRALAVEIEAVRVEAWNAVREACLRCCDDTIYWQARNYIESVVDAKPAPTGGGAR